MPFAGPESKKPTHSKPGRETAYKQQEISIRVIDVSNCEGRLNGTSKKEPRCMGQEPLFDHWVANR